jgi:hypothetical protein
MLMLTSNSGSGSFRFRFSGAVYRDGVMFQVGPVSPSTWGIFQLVLSHLVTFGQPECNIRHEIIGRIDLHVQTPTCVPARNDRRIRLD